MAHSKKHQDERIVKGPITNGMVVSLNMLSSVIVHTCFNLIKYDKIDKKVSASAETRMAQLSCNVTTSVIRRLEERKAKIEMLKKHAAVESKGSGPAKADKTYLFFRDNK